MDHLLSMENFVEKKKSEECPEVSMIKFMKGIQRKAIDDFYLVLREFSLKRFCSLKTR